MFEFEEEEDHKSFYRKSLKMYGAQDVRALRWNSQRSQEARFRQFLRVGSLEGTNILDLGCGTGDFRGFLQKRKIVPSRYTGIDFLKEFVDVAQRRYPEDNWVCGDFFQLDAGRYDIVLCNGALNVRKSDNIKYLNDFVSHFLPMTKEILVFTLLKPAKGYLEDPMIHPYRVQEVHDLLKVYRLPFQIHEGYVDNDFTCFVYTGSTE